MNKSTSNPRRRSVTIPIQSADFDQIRDRKPGTVDAKIGISPALKRLLIYRQRSSFNRGSQEPFKILPASFAISESCNKPILTELPLCRILPIHSRLIGTNLNCLAIRYLLIDTDVLKGGAWQQADDFILWMKIRWRAGNEISRTTSA